MGFRIFQDLHELKPSPPAGEQAEAPTIPAPPPSPGTPAPPLLTLETLFPPLSLRMLTRWKGIPRGLYSSCESVYTAPPQLLRAPCRQTGAPAFKDPPEQVGQLSVTGAAAKPPGSPAGRLDQVPGSPGTLASSMATSSPLAAQASDTPEPTRGLCPLPSGSGKACGAARPPSLQRWGSRLGPSAFAPREGVGRASLETALFWHLVSGPGGSQPL